MSESKLFILAGQTFGRLTARAPAERRGGSAYWHCACACGQPKVVKERHLLTGNTKSCGCLRREVTGNARRTHAASSSKAFSAWSHMRRRCADRTGRHWAHYGARGIAVCDRWQVFENFLADMGHAPPGTWLDRIDNDRGYEPGNCRWATPTEQTRNTTRNIVLERGGRAQCLSAWCEELGVSYRLVHNRVYKLGWDAARALETPKAQR